MNKAVISGDIVASTSLPDIGRSRLENDLLQVITILSEEKLILFGRIIKGDYIECVVSNPEDALRVLLIFKCYVKSLAGEMNLEDSSSRIKLFKIYGIKLAIGYGGLSRFDPEKGIIDGEAIYLSGRKINELSTFGKQRISLKNSLFFVSAYSQLNMQFEALFSLLDVLLNKATARQCEVVYYKLLGMKEDQIVQKMNVSQPVINQHSSGAGWNAIELAVNYYSQIIKQQSS
jgi:hypothetical protein